MSVIYEGNLELPAFKWAPDPPWQGTLARNIRQMVYRILADFVLIVHFAFVVFAVFGALLVVRWRWIVWIHVPLALWAVMVEFTGWICPLTPLEHWLRTKSGVAVQDIGFVEEYILPLLYPAALTRRLQIVLGGIVLGINGLIYSWAFRCHLRATT
jgi:hypothetical protein